MKKNFDLHVFDDEVLIVAKLFSGEMNFFVGRVVGENEIIARLIGKGEIAGFQRCLIDLFDRAVTFIKTVSSAQVSDFTAVNRLAFSGFRKLEVGNDARVAINFSPFFRSDALYIGFSSKNEARIMQNHRYSAKTQRKI